MSGIELALASIPLAITAYQAISPFLKSIFQFPKAVDTILKSLRIQQTIFNADVKFLLLLVTESPVVTKQMLEDPSSYSWKSRKFNLRLRQLLDDSTEICVQTGRELQNSLEILNEKLSDLSGRSADGPGKSNGKLASRIVFALSSNIQENAQKVETRVQNFHTMVDQALREARYQSKLQKKLMNIAKEQEERDDDIEAFRAVQGVAGSLHKALGSACTKHINHTVHLCLRLDCEPNQVRFRVSFNKGAAPTTSDHLWLAVESVRKGTAKTYPVVAPSDRRLKRQHSNDHIEIRKAVKAIGPHSVRQAGGRNGHTSPSLAGNLCTMVQKAVSVCSLRCLGRLQEAELYTHRVYLDCPPLYKPQSMAYVPLLKLKPPSRSSDTPTATGEISLSLFNRVQLAKELAVAVLNLHNTPWLASWRSENILFYAPEAGTAKLKHHAQLVDTFLTTNTEAGRTDTNRIEVSQPENNWYRNLVLFRLAVMLLELAFEAPLKDLQSPEDEIRGKTQAGAEYMAARRLCQQSAGRVDMRYKNIIEKCLYCDFGCGDDLNHADLQMAFSSRVIGELGQLEEDIKQLEIV